MDLLKQVRNLKPLKEFEDSQHFLQTHGDDCIQPENYGKLYQFDFLYSKAEEVSFNSRQGIFEYRKYLNFDVDGKFMMFGFIDAQNHINFDVFDLFECCFVRTFVLQNLKTEGEFCHCYPAGNNTLWILFESKTSAVCRCFKFSIQDGTLLAQENINREVGNFISNWTWFINNGHFDTNVEKFKGTSSVFDEIAKQMFLGKEDDLYFLKMKINNPNFFDITSNIICLKYDEQSGVGLTGVCTTNYEFNLEWFSEYNGEQYHHAFKVEPGESYIDKFFVTLRADMTVVVFNFLMDKVGLFF